MTDQKDFLKRVLDALENAGIAYMLSGSLGSSFHGRPRATNDVDIVIAASQTQLATFLKSLGKQYYFSADAVRDAFEHNAMFNASRSRLREQVGHKPAIDRPSRTSSKTSGQTRGLRVGSGK